MQALKWCGASRCTVMDCTSAIARPSDDFLKKIIDILDKSEEYFKGLRELCEKAEVLEASWEEIFISIESVEGTHLKNKPNSSTYTSDWPCQEEKESYPENSEDWILCHVARVCCLLIERLIERCSAFSVGFVCVRGVLSWVRANEK